MAEAESAGKPRFDKTAFEAGSRQPGTGKHTRFPHDPYKSVDVGSRVSAWHGPQDISGELGLGLNGLAIRIPGGFVKPWRAGDRPGLEKALE